MKKIDSFCVNHLTLEPGIYLSRRDVTPSGDVISTYDIRLTRPNREDALDPRALHAMEHLVATYLRNHPEWASKVVYWGPMGCLTGNYLILQGDREPAELVGLMTEAMEFVAEFDGEIPGATPRDCGNYSFMDLDKARKAARRFLETLTNITPDNLNYPA
ncbi:MAG: S-ribosylhomocysteine lyase [Muribaculaceae bacterium]|nr:S-ribosylhomocysteine lyase [Muribaculaceae bacterium]MDE7394005.1 S-ribosylhomocysteine lyase [Muribaculaceae bacterium]